MARRTPTYRLIDHLLDGTFDTFVKTRRADGRSWRLIARDIYDATGVDVTLESVRGWFLDENGEAA